ncbi:MAG: 7-carboxy-7-deazaguanine synthase QueE [Paludibacter sp.]|nr:7-carboxy-7-deazaguanine synthase QueE [Bacteroidales bacterium]MCM1069710.1 7-carboxy-7-deazaguanine synthase QueE [Prevotella sp.]MCM1354382.1 7-carboxy-7-deazaguanine synthase QueE [Bacteroides sp.]MCM1441929.1 7-carboxy-7-deazaguanine synthase QueE [Muribaculum sp.]MCM1482580.1 7-carboxy-7-deazaguanine synthase QueE [Paludibacter sp.]
MNATDNGCAMRQYRINEIFLSLQGEGRHTGMPAVFVRFCGCNLRCAFCDTDFAEGKYMSASQIADAVVAAGGKQGMLLVLTGGEPSLQVDDDLLMHLRSLRMTICMETNGTHVVPAGVDWITCSPKEGTDVVLHEVNELKVVYTETDVEHWRNDIRAEYYYLQPCSCKNTQEVINYILHQNQQGADAWRLSLQTHKYLSIR